jgi:hypothetical protein
VCSLLSEVANAISLGRCNAQDLALDKKLLYLTHATADAAEPSWLFWKSRPSWRDLSWGVDVANAKPMCGRRGVMVLMLMLMLELEPCGWGPLWVLPFACFCRGFAPSRAAEK